MENCFTKITDISKSDKDSVDEICKSLLIFLQILVKKNGTIDFEKEEEELRLLSNKKKKVKTNKHKKKKIQSKLSKWYFGNNLKSLFDCDLNGHNTVHFAIIEGDIDILEWLFNHPLFIKPKKDNFGWNLQHYAAAIGNLEVLKFLNSKGFDLFEENDDKKQPVHILVKCSSIHFVEWEKIYSIYSKKYSDEKKGGVNVLKWILNIEKHLPVMCENYNFENKYLESLKYFYELDKNILLDNTDSEKSVVFIASYVGNLDMLKWMYSILRNNIFLKLKGISIIHEASASGQTHILKWIVSKGIDISKNNKWHYTPCRIATYFGHFKTLEYLIECGCSYENKDKDNNNLLHISARKKHFKIFFYLSFLSKLNVFEKNNKGESSVAIAEKNGFKDWLAKNTKLINHNKLKCT